jgi:hypothetical protein
MEFPAGYTIALTQEQINANWPALIEGATFEFTSLKRKGYNCVGFALGEEGKDLDMLVFSKHFDLLQFGLSNTPLDHSVNGYAKLFRALYNFEICDSYQLEEGIEKIALYENEDESGEKGFSHIALQLENGIWKSKLGSLEDIEHTELSALNGNFYGEPVLFMRRERGIYQRHFR